MTRDTAECMVVLYVLTCWFARDSQGEAWYERAIEACGPPAVFNKEAAAWSLFWWATRYHGDAGFVESCADLVSYLEYKKRTAWRW